VNKGAAVPLAGPKETGGPFGTLDNFDFNCTCSVMFVGGTSLYEITITFWLRVAFITFNFAVFPI
jgi:hypothetical protein